LKSTIPRGGIRTLGLEKAGSMVASAARPPEERGKIPPHPPFFASVPEATNGRPFPGGQPHHKNNHLKQEAKNAFL